MTLDEVMTKPLPEGKVMFERSVDQQAPNYVLSVAVHELLDGMPQGTYLKVTSHGAE